jgi:hypothetical protein
MIVQAKTDRTLIERHKIELHSGHACGTGMGAAEAAHSYRKAGLNLD